MSAHRAPKLRQRTLIVGSGLVADRLAERINDHPELGLALTGFIDDRQAGDQGTADLPCLGGLRALSDLVELDLVDRVMIAFTRAHHEELLHALRVCRDAGVAVDIVPRLFEFLDGARIDRPDRRDAAALDRRADVLRRLALQQAHARPDRRERRCSSRSRRCWSLIAIAIKLDSRGPVLFTQPRSGRGGQFFKLYKFRSMHAEATGRGARRTARSSRRATTSGSPASAASSAASRSTRRRSCSTCSRAT